MLSLDMGKRQKRLFYWMIGCVLSAKAFVTAVFACKLWFEYVFFVWSCGFHFVPFYVLVLKEEWPCRKKRGQQPTGLLAHTAKKSGFNSVSDMLRKKASEGSELNSAAVLLKEDATLKKVCWFSLHFSVVNM